jgi:hypothetical protein
LADHSGVSKPTIVRLEATDSDDPIGGRPETGEALIAALVKAGVEFIPENGGGAGVLWAEFAKGKMTWGQFNTGRKSIIEESRARMVQTNMRIGSQLEGTTSSRDTATSASGRSAFRVGITTAGNCASATGHQCDQ